MRFHLHLKSKFVISVFAFAMNAVLIDSNARLDIACVTSENKEAGPDLIFGHFGHIVCLHLTCTRSSGC